MKGKGTYKNLLFLIVSIVILFVVFSMINGTTSNVKDVKYSTFMNYIEQDLSLIHI